MSARNNDSKGRWRNVTVAFRVSPEENEEINMRAKLSGFQTKQEFMIQSITLYEKIRAVGKSVNDAKFQKISSGNNCAAKENRGRWKN